MPYKSTNKKLVFSILLTISSSQWVISQQFNNSNNRKPNSVIGTLSEYLSTIKLDSNKRMVNIQYFINPFFIDWIYASRNNFTRKKLYHKPVPFLRYEIAKALYFVQEDLKKLNLSLYFYDAYRPWSVTKKMWKMVPDEKYAANPAKGSNHNRGAAVDVGLVNIINGQKLSMPTEFDDFSIKAHHNYNELPPEAIKNRQILKSVMEKYGFVALDTEWWHYSWPAAADKFEVLDLSFKELKKMGK